MHCVDICSEGTKATVGKTADVLPQIKAVPLTALGDISFSRTCLLKILCYDRESINTVLLLYTKVQQKKTPNTCVVELRAELAPFPMNPIFM